MRSLRAEYGEEPAHYFRKLMFTISRLYGSSFLDEVWIPTYEQLDRMLERIEYVRSNEGN